jgi:hypothetical protein
MAVGERLRGTWHGLLGADKGAGCRDAAMAVEHAMRTCLATVRSPVARSAWHCEGCV